MAPQEQYRILITESGILNKEDVKLTTDTDIYACLIGEAFMRQEDPGQALATMLVQD
ncbi:indole-3-glycerol phosphate synthase TrpC [Oligella ureolytica]